MMPGFEMMDKRFDQIDKCFEEVDKHLSAIVDRIDRFVFWSLSLIVSATLL
ncbi:MAG: hypothetical protein ACXV7E_04795 [Methylobacter sp.]